MKHYNLAVVGATGMVGRKMLEVLAERKLPIGNFYAFASPRSAGSAITFCGKQYTVIELTEENIKAQPLDFAIFSAGGETSRVFAPIFAAAGCIVVDNSSQWRMDPSVPLVVPEVNPDALKSHANIIANPNCSTIQAVVALAPLHRRYGIKRIVYSTYQAVSGAGLAGWTDLENGVKGMPPQKFSRPIFGNVIPQIDVFLDNGYTKEEDKMIRETRKILGDESLKITATTVRVPVYNGHSESVNIEFKRKPALSVVRKILKSSPGITVVDDIKRGKFPTPLDCSGRDDVFVGRIRLDDSVKNGLNLWVVSDNIRKGAATNAVQIVETLIRG
ncbi:MAG: aspartate-semialdehyde dehydrogenase [Firmicutes bacterium]|nr:aspartate-semialdehyde dehydrogenase [Bacillota bacterium]